MALAQGLFRIGAQALDAGELAAQDVMVGLVTISLAESKRPPLITPSTWRMRAPASRALARAVPSCSLNWVSCCSLTSWERVPTRLCLARKAWALFSALRRSSRSWASRPSIASPARRVVSERVAASRAR